MLQLRNWHLQEEESPAYKEKLKEMLNPRELYVEMDGGFTAKEAYFKGADGGILCFPAVYHAGTYADSVYIAGSVDGCTFDWSFFPRGDSIECYRWYGIDAVRLWNMSERDFIFRGCENFIYSDVLCKAGEITAINAKEELTSRDVILGEKTEPMLTQEEIVKLLTFTE